MTKDILTLLELSKEEMDNLFQRAIELKRRHKQGIRENSLSGKTLGLLFDKASTRTRISFEAAMVQMGGVPTFISAKDTQIARNEPIKDTARVMSRYLDALVIRTYSQSTAEDFAKWSSIPIINGLTDLHHPCQVLSDIMTVIECKGGYQGLNVAWVGDGNNVAHAWINAASVLGFNLTLACPEGYQPGEEIVQNAKCKVQSAGGGVIRLTADPVEAVKAADVINTDVWASMGQESEAEARKKIFAPYQVNAELMAKAHQDVIVMHCLPAHREEEITDEVMEGSHSVVWNQAENKLHLHKALLEMLILR
ncbi:MAG: ornithine carbamoyltransferase [Desulfobacteraceae bacterium IS3]|nr:MAG: ornithine carbamoyltransferase [Desulfobacteraceae bacterium IS3]HAO21610.1 ornithine carbamoyltransferase [Desulfobacteraceae bacterium]